MQKHAASAPLPLPHSVVPVDDTDPLPRRGSEPLGDRPGGPADDMVVRSYSELPPTPKAGDSVEIRTGSLDEHFTEIEACRCAMLDDTSPCSDKVQHLATELAQARVKFELVYKTRKSIGSALHVASMRPEGADAVRWLLQMRADVNSQCKYKAFHKESTALPIHLAVQSGEVEVLRALIDGGASVNSQALRGIERHFRPLHEAAFFRDVAIARFLLDSEADINCQNLELMTPLHVAARMGAADVAELLVNCGANIQLLDMQDCTPLKAAVEAGIFPFRRLHILASWRITDIMAVAEFCPSATEEFMRCLQREHQDQELQHQVEAIRIERCGEERANGLWHHVGDRCGKPEYASEQWPGATVAWHPECKAWQMTVSGYQETLYRSRMNVDRVPESGWEGVLGSPGPPHVTPDALSSMVGHWIELMHRAPDAGDELLEILTNVPREQSVFYHGLPKQAAVTEMHCEYRADTVWRFDAEHSDAGLNRQFTSCTGKPNARSSHYPEWHDRLAPGTPGRVTRLAATKRLDLKNPADTVRGTAEAVRHLGVQLQKKKKSKLTPVYIRYLRMPGVVCAEVLQVLAQTPRLEIFRSQAAQAILKYTWESFVRRCHLMLLLQRFLELAVLVSFIYLSPVVAGEKEFADRFWYRWYTLCACSLFSVSAARETFSEACQAYGHTTVLYTPEAYLAKGLTYMDVAAIGLFNVFALDMMVHVSGGTLLTPSQTVVVTSAVAVSRWIQLMYTLRPYKLAFVGSTNFMPILNSFKKIGGMFIVVIFFFFGFAHAAIVLEGNPYRGVTGTMVNIFRFLLLGDGEGVNALLMLGEEDGSWATYYEDTGNVVTRIFLFVAVIVFCIILMNLFIAVIGEAYSEAFREGAGLHLQERASICVDYMLQPAWPLQWGCCQRCRSRCRGESGGRRLPCHPLVAYACLAAVALPLWAGWLALAAWQDCAYSSFGCLLLHPALPSAFLFTAVLLGNSFLAQRPWESIEERERSYLWWCAPIHGASRLAEETALQERGDLDALSERLASVESSVQEILFELRCSVSGGNPSSTPMNAMTSGLSVGSSSARVPAARSSRKRTTRAPNRAE